MLPLVDAETVNCSKSDSNALFSITSVRGGEEARRVSWVLTYPCTLELLFGVAVIVLCLNDALVRECIKVIDRAMSAAANRKDVAHQPRYWWLSSIF